MKVFGILLLLSVLTYVRADVDITSPTQGSTFSPSGGSVAIDLIWKDDDDSSDPTSLANVLTYTISLCTGTGASIECFKQLLVGKAVTSNSFSATIKSTDAPNGWFFFQVYAKFTGTGFTNHYSPRFELTGMSGASTTVIGSTNVALILTETGAPPAAQIAVGDGVINTLSFTLLYTQQSGRVKYAPMQTQPGTTVTATTWSMKYPTSSVTYYSAISGTPNAKTTYTPGWDYTMTSAPNWASVAPYPTYYYPASERVLKASLSSAGKRKKRWLE